MKKRISKKSILVMAAVAMTTTLFGGAVILIPAPATIWPISLFSSQKKTRVIQKNSIAYKHEPQSTSNEVRDGELRGGLTDTGHTSEELKDELREEKVVGDREGNSENSGKAAEIPEKGGEPDNKAHEVESVPFEAPSAQYSKSMQLVRALQLVQDRLAQGDADAVPLQRKSLNAISEVITELSNDNAKLTDILAACAYLFSGGRPDAVEKFLEKKDLPVPVKSLLNGAMAYARGDQAAASGFLRDLEPNDFSPMIAGHLSIVKAHVIKDASDQQRMLFLQSTVNLLPGTLLEEAALRRLIELSAKQTDRKVFLSVVNRYNRRFTNSIYSREYRDALLKGIFLFAGKAGEALSEANMDELLFQHLPGRRNELLAHILDFAVRSGDAELCRYAATRTRRLSRENSASWTRATLRYMACSVVIDSAQSALDFDTLDISALSSDEKALLASARRLDHSIRSPAMHKFKEEKAKNTSEAQPEDFSATKDKVKSELQFSQGIISESMQ